MMITNSPSQKISKPGVYSGYSQQVYYEYARTSRYVAVRDGTKLAVDIYRPAVKGKPIDKPCPVIWALNRHLRAEIVDGELQIDATKDILNLTKYGYVVAAVDSRGGGASYGSLRGAHCRDEAWDGYDITEWFAAQPWCDGKVGMYGCSALGVIQYLIASTRPPHLKAIFPRCAEFDKYWGKHTGGVFNDKLWLIVEGDAYKRNLSMDAVPVDEDTNKAMLAKAVAEHKGNNNTGDICAAMPYRNSRSKKTKSMFWLEASVSTYLREIEMSGVAIYLQSGWADSWPKDQFLLFRNLNNPKKVIIGPWTHCDSEGFDYATEHLRWYDYWLKGIENGILKEPPIYYYTVGAPRGNEWRFASQWPLPHEKPTKYYFTDQRSGSVNSVNDKSLTTQLPEATNGADTYTVDYTTSSGMVSWGGRTSAIYEDDQTANDSKGLTYTTVPLELDTELTGTPVIHLWVSSTAKDGDFFAYLEEVDERSSHFVSAGVLRASHRAISTPPYDTMGLPWHSSFKEDCADLVPESPVELVFDLKTISKVFKAGHRIRVTITCADQKIWQTPELSPPPTVSIYREANRASYIILPVIPAK